MSYPAAMATSTALLRMVIVAFVLLGTLQAPQDRSHSVGFHARNIGGIWLVYGSEFNNDDNDWAEDDLGQRSGKHPPLEDSEVKAFTGKGATKKSGSLRGADLKGNKTEKKRFENKELEGIFEGLLKTLSDVSRLGTAVSMVEACEQLERQPQMSQLFSLTSPPFGYWIDALHCLIWWYCAYPVGFQENHDFAVEQAQDVHRLNELVDRAFPPRLQTTPKYQGALECLNEALYRDILSGPNKKTSDNRQLQQAYKFLRNPPVMLQVPVLFVDLRAAADQRLWDVERAAERKRYERRGDPVPERLLLTADELVARDAEKPRVREEDLSEEEIFARVLMINGWLKQQFRLRLYYRKRIGTLKGDPQELLLTFDAGPKYVAVAIEDIEGLSFDAELDPEPTLEDTETDEAYAA